MGPFLPGAEAGFVEAQPVLAKTRLAVSNSLTRLASELGLTPASRARINADPDRGPGAEMARVFRAGARSAKAQDEEPIDADFEAEDEEAVESGE